MKLKRLIVSALRCHLAGEKSRAPEGAGILWKAFAQLSRARTWHANGPNPISYSEVEAYCCLMQLPLEPRHIEILAAMDEVWIAHVMTRAGKAAGISSVSKHAMTGELFDAMFG